MADYVPLSTLPDALASTMTHWPQQPNPAQPYIDALAAFAKGGLQGVANQRGIETPDWSKAAGNVLSSDAANAAIGMAAPLKGPIGFGEAAVPKGITAYHGSPHDFEKFDISKIGTGEGAQAYGHGLYFAENPKVAEGYQDALSHPARVRMDQTPLPYIEGQLFEPRNHEIMQIAQSSRDPDVVASKLKDYIKRSGDDNPYSHNEDAQHIIDAIHAGKYSSGLPGRMYEVAIKAHPDEFLDWDKPLSEQPELFNRLKQAGIIHEKSPPYQKTGKGTAQALIQMPEERGAIEQKLREAGIPGIKYLDQGSRPPRSYKDTLDSIKYYEDALKARPDDKFSAQQLAQYKDDLRKHTEGTHNYVVFDDKLIDILKKYGLAGALALPALGTGNKPQTQ